MPESENLDEKQSSWNTSKNRKLTDMTQPFYDKTEYEKKQKENSDTKAIEFDPATYDSTIQLNQEPQIPSKDELTNDQQSNEKISNNEINKTKEKDIQEINFNNGLNNNKQTENNNEINTFSKYEKQFEELTYVKIIIDDKNNN